MVVYLADTGQLDQAALFRKMLEQMPEERRQKIEAVKNDAVKKLSLAVGALLDLGLRSYGLSYRAVTIEKGAHEKPYIVGEHVPYFNLSHSGTKAVCAIGDTEVGIDIERIREKEVRKSLIQKVCTPDERAFLQEIASETAQKEQFYKLWTVKESLMKQCGRGLSMMPDTIDAAEAFRQDCFVCQEKSIRIYREQDYYISVCCVQGESVELRQVDLEKI